MKNEPIATILGINFLILAVYSASWTLWNLDGLDPLRIVLTMGSLAMVIGLHATVNFILAFMYHSKERKKLVNGYMISGIIVLMIGYSVCMGIYGEY